MLPQDTAPTSDDGEISAAAPATSVTPRRRGAPEPRRTPG
ncbi:Hypothetical protein CAP_6126 [Chondromyces apiculatus DSM 436]|uniref:Uncharacterized protein n=1 Tax=Chondromyces apiculatus DSM 436 TaxID=1192034 RepID=A0A017T2T2_9BACT|nr:Hypothetical protein CAP_6126 [Chondromyces apiculatus DSM 436]